MRAAVAALQMANNGLEWYRDACPGLVNGSDDEANEQIDRALNMLVAALTSPPGAQDKDKQVHLTGADSVNRTKDTP